MADATQLAPIECEIIDFNSRRRVPANDDLIQSRAYLERAKRDQSPIALQIAALHLLKALKQNG
jgi:hypothetical protein